MSVHAAQPQRRVLRNSQIILEATVHAAAEEGWHGLTFAGVAHRASMSRTPLHNRFEDPSAMAATAWRERAEPALRSAIGEVLAGAGLLDEAPSADRLADALERVTVPDIDLRAASQFLLMAQFDTTLKHAVAETMGAQLQAWCRPGEPPASIRRSAWRAYLIGASVGLLMTGRRPGVDRIPIGLMADLLMGASQQDVLPAPLPPERASHIDRPVPFDSGDSTLDALLQACLDEVGELGYEGTSVERIAKRADSSQGALFARFPTKLALFLEATRLQSAHGLRANEEYMSRLAEQYGRGIAEAAMIREFMRPGREHQRAIALELLRLSWHEPKVAATLYAEVQRFITEAAMDRDPTQAAKAHFGFALGSGLLALTILCPHCWQMPFDVVTVPLDDWAATTS